LLSDDPHSDARLRASKVDPRYVDGELVKIAQARHQAEAELIQGLLLDRGVPSMLRRTRGFDVPDMLAAGPRDVMVPSTGAMVAREALNAAEIDVSQGAEVVRAGPLAAWLIGAVVVAGLIAWIGAELIG
jgi:hypothetical protein